MTRVKLERASRLTNFSFEPPILHSSGVEDQFFGMVYRAVSPILPINLQEFSAITRANLSEPFAKYRIFGGPSTVSLSANVLSVDFPDHMPEDTELILRILDSLNSGLLAEFPQHTLTSINVVMAGHYTVLDPGGAPSYLRRFAVPAASELKDVIHMPGTRFSLRDRQGTWWSRCTVELSEALHDGVFVMHDTSVLKMTDKSLESHLTVYNDALSACMRALAMEMEDG